MPLKTPSLQEMSNIWKTNCHIHNLKEKPLTKYKLSKYKWLVSITFKPSMMEDLFKHISLWERNEF